jgi:predicted N-acetyltransferase YhbS
VDGEFLIAELTDDDLPGVVSLCRTALDLPEDAAEAAEIVLRLRESTGTESWSSRPRRLAGFVARVPGPPGAADRLVGVALGSVSHRDPSIGHVDLIAVEEAERRRGIGRALISRVEGALAGLGAGDVVIAGNPPYYGWPGIDVRYTPAICATTAWGFEQDQPAWNMTADLSGEHPRSTAEAEDRLAAEGITVRRAALDDAPGLIDFARTHYESLWHGEIAHSVGRDGAGCHLAVDRDGAILGFAAYGSSRPSWFGPMGTAPAAQGKGIGSVLLRRCLADQRAAGFDTVQIGWVGPLPFYSTVVDARVGRVFLLYRKQL